MAIEQLGGWQIARSRVDGRLFIVKAKRRIGLGGEREIGVVEGFDGSDIFPVIFEQIGLHVVICCRRGKDFLSEIGSVRRSRLANRAKLASQTHRFPWKRCREIRSPFLRASPRTVVSTRIVFQSVAFGLFAEREHATAAIDFHQTEVVTPDSPSPVPRISVTSALVSRWRCNKIRVVHPIQMIAGQESSIDRRPIPRTARDICARHRPCPSNQLGLSGVCCAASTSTNPWEKPAPASA